MAVTVHDTPNAFIRRISGNIDEVIDKIDNDGVDRTDLINIYHDGVEHVAVYWHSG